MRFPFKRAYTRKQLLLLYGWKTSTAVIVEPLSGGFRDTAGIVRSPSNRPDRGKTARFTAHAFIALTRTRYKHHVVNIFLF